MRSQNETVQTLSPQPDFVRTALEFFIVIFGYRLGFSMLPAQMRKGLHFLGTAEAGCFFAACAIRLCRRLYIFPQCSHSNKLADLLTIRGSFLAHRSLPKSKRADAVSEFCLF